MVYKPLQSNNAPIFVPKTTNPFQGLTNLSKPWKNPVDPSMQKKTRFFFGVPLLGGGFKISFIFTPIWGRFQILTNIFQMGWNHQLD